MQKRAMCCGFLLLIVSFLPALQTGVALQGAAAIGNSSVFAGIGPSVTLDFPVNDTELSLEAYTRMFFGSQYGLNLKIWYAPLQRQWRPRLGAGLGVAGNNRLIHTRDLADLRMPAGFTVNACASLEPLRFIAGNGDGISLLAIDLFTDLNGPAIEIGAGITLFRLLSRLPSGKREPAADSPYSNPTKNPSASTGINAGLQLDFAAFRLFGIYNSYIPDTTIHPHLILGYDDFELQLSCTRLLFQDGWQEGPKYPAVSIALMASPPLGWYRPQAGIGAWLSSLPRSAPEDAWEILPDSLPAADTDPYLSWFVRAAPLRIGFSIGPVELCCSCLDFFYGPVIPVGTSPGFRIVGDTGIGINFGSVSLAYHRRQP